MSDVISVIEKQIQNKQSVLTDLKDQIAKTLDAIPKLEADLNALNRTLAILKGEEYQEQQSTLKPLSKGHTIFKRRIIRSNTVSIPHLVSSILKEAGKPLTGDQIIPVLAAKGKLVTRNTLLSVIYRLIQHKKIFKLVSPGTFGLLEWDKDNSLTEDSLPLL